MKTEILVEKYASGTPVILSIREGEIVTLVRLMHDEALELAGALRDCVQAEHKYGEGMEVESL